MNNGFVFICAVLLLSGCVSSGPKTEYYSLFAIQDMPESAVQQTVGDNVSIGVGPIFLPDFMDNPAIVSTLSSQQVRVSGRYAWAGDLKTSITRVLASDLSVLLGTDNISQFPWDTRIRPDYQLRIHLNRFNGERGKTSELSASWVLIDTQSRESVITQSTRLSVVSDDDSIEAYVRSLNVLLNRYAEKIAGEVNGYLKTEKFD